MNRKFWNRYKTQINKTNRKELEHCILNGMKLDEISQLNKIDKDLILEFAKQTKTTLEKLKYKKKQDIPLSKIMSYKHFLQNHDLTSANKKKIDMPKGSLGTNASTIINIKEENKTRKQKLLDEKIRKQKEIKELKRLSKKECKTIKLSKEDFAKFLDELGL